MKFEYDGRFYLVFSDGMRYEIDKDIWERLKKIKEGETI